mmetsp:Transcript_59278/g.105795  ORF Transcript_59278/g.105795 Transcript_59278/m.105795 type:complete len:289 (-) Transcript_59278:55-921(-)
MPSQSQVTRNCLVICEVVNDDNASRDQEDHEVQNCNKRKVERNVPVEVLNDLPRHEPHHQLGRWHSAVDQTGHGGPELVALNHPLTDGEGVVGVDGHHDPQQRPQHQDRSGPLPDDRQEHAQDPRQVRSEEDLEVPKALVQGGQEEGGDHGYNGLRAEAAEGQAQARAGHHCVQPQPLRPEEGDGVGGHPSHARHHQQHHHQPPLLQHVPDVGGRLLEVHMACRTPDRVGWLRQGHDPPAATLLPFHKGDAASLGCQFRATAAAGAVQAGEGRQLKGPGAAFEGPAMA